MIKIKFISFQLPQNSIKASDIAVSMIIDSNSTGLAFLWEMTPVLGTEALPIYSTDEFKLPGAPWMKDL